MADDHSLNRRGFLARLPVIPATAAALASGCAGVPYATGRPSPAGLRVPVLALADGVEVLVEVPGERFPIYVRRMANGSFTAVSLRCTHRGCQPEPEADRLTCPCHGSEFDFDGAVLQGPAEQPLTGFDVGVENDDLVIKPTEGSASFYGSRR